MTVEKMLLRASIWKKAEILSKFDGEKEILKKNITEVSLYDVVQVSQKTNWDLDQVARIFQRYKEKEAANG